MKVDIIPPVDNIAFADLSYGDVFIFDGRPCVKFASSKDNSIFNTVELGNSHNRFYIPFDLEVRKAKSVEVRL